jgi:RNA polymerase sporulation-specific sigma factor
MYDNRNTRPLTPEQRALVEANVGCVGWFLGQRNSVVQTIGYDDAFQIGCLGLMKAARNYDPTRGKFSTLAMIEIRNAIMHSIRESKAVRRTPRAGTISMDAAIDTGHDVETITVRDTIADPAPSPEEAYIQCELLSAAREVLDSDDLLRAYCSDEKPQKEIADELGMRQASISRSIKRQLRAARKQIDTN